MLETLARSPAPRGVSELARELDLNKSNVHRTLQTLVKAGYVRAAGPSSGTYECTLKLFEIASQVVARIDVRSNAESHMQALASHTQETVHLAVLDGLDVIYLNKIESPQPVRAYSMVGGRAPAYGVASGKALLAYQGESALSSLPHELPAYTPHTITKRDPLLAELAAIRRQGYAVNRGEWRETVCGLAAIVLDAFSRPVAAIGISGPAARLRPSILREHRGVVVDTACRLSEQLGCPNYRAAIQERRASSLTVATKEV